MVDDEIDTNKMPLMINRKPTAFTKLEKEESSSGKLLQLEASFEIAPEAEEEEEEDKEDEKLNMLSQQPTEYPEFYLLARLESKGTEGEEVFID